MTLNSASVLLFIIVSRKTFEPIIYFPRLLHLSHPCFPLNCLVPLTNAFAGASQVTHLNKIVYTLSLTMIPENNIYLIPDSVSIKNSRSLGLLPKCIAIGKVINGS